MSDVAMQCKETSVSLSLLAEYAKVPIRFEVHSLFEIEGDNPASAVLIERKVDQPWIKDYDAIEGEGPIRWAKRWDVSNWGMLIASTGDQPVGGTVLAHNTDGVNKLEGRDDLVAMWDIRVQPDARGQGIGHILFEAAVEWARERHCSEIKIETQNINVPACRFYQRQGCSLSSINREAYEELPEEIELIWSLAI